MKDDTQVGSLSHEYVPPQRLRIVFGKQGAMKYIGHLDLSKTWERILRRAQILLAYSQGFNARPKIQFASPLPLGYTSDAELVDIRLEKPIPLEGLAAHLMSVSPPGLPIYSVSEVPHKAPALQTLIESATYQITFEDVDPADLRARCEALLAQETILRTRRDRPYDLRPLIRALHVDEAGCVIVELAVSAAAGGTGRADEVIDALGLADRTARIHRTAIGLNATPISMNSESDATADAETEAPEALNE